METPATRTDEDLVAASIGEAALFGFVFERHYVRVRGYCMRRLGRGAGEAAAGEVFARAFTRRDHYHAAAGDVIAWLFGITTNVICEQRRDETQRLRLIVRLAGNGWAPPPETAADALEVFERGRPGRDAAAGLLALSPADRDALLLVAWAGLSYRQLAAIAELPLGTVRSRLHRARRTLRDHLDEGNRDG